MPTREIFPIQLPDGTFTYNAPKNNPKWEQAAANHLAHCLSALRGRGKVAMHNPDMEIKTILAYLKQVHPRIP